MPETDPDQAPGERLGLLGGTFDPPHAGHLAAARAVLSALNLDRVDLLPANEPWQKTDAGTKITPAATRLAMVRALVRGVDGLGVDDREIRRGGPTFTVDTLREIRAESPSTEIYLIVGADTAAGLSTWREPDEVLALSTLVVVNRDGQTPDVPRAAGRVRTVEMPAVDVSSTRVRAAVAQGRDVTAEVGSAVAAIIAADGLYGARP